MFTHARSRPNQLMFAAGSRQLPVAPPLGGDVPERLSGRTSVPGFTPSAIMSPGFQKGPCTQIRLGGTAHSRTPPRSPAP